MRFFFFIIGFALMAPSAYALNTPPVPTAISPYVQAIFTNVESYLSGNTGGGSGACNSYEEITNLRKIFMDTKTSFGAPQEDIARSVCFVNDIYLLEQYLAGLIDFAATEAAACNTISAQAYRSAAAVVWGHLTQLRQHGLDPDFQSPIGTAYVESVPSGAAPEDDNVLCPYHSGYGGMSFADVGCQYAILPAAASPVLAEEVTLLRRILFQMKGDGFLGLDVELPLLHGLLTNVVNHVDTFVSSITVTRSVRPVFRYVPSYVSRTIDNAGESGCVGWPSDVTTGPVTGDNVPLQEYFPYILTNELAEAFSFIEKKYTTQNFEYMQRFRSGFSDSSATSSELMYNIPGLNITATNQAHFQSELSNIFSLREPQAKNAILADLLHNNVRKFAGQAALFPGSPFDPSLRDFVRRYTTFLSRMCTNRGCDNRLLRTFELSLRNECFSSFIMNHFFQENPTESSLPACKAIFVPL